MSDSHDFCRVTLKAAREEAKEAKIILPKRITALQGTTCITNGQYFIEADGVKGEFYYGDCAFDAKTKYVRAIIDGTLKPQAAEFFDGLAADAACGKRAPTPSQISAGYGKVE
jgi:hypothetical protein